MTVGRGELFNEVEGNEVLWSGRNGELSNEPKRLVSRGLVLLAEDAAINKILNISRDIGPCVISSEQVECAVLARLSCERLVVLEL